MICLDNTDTLEGGASTDAKVDYTVHGLVGTTFTVLADGQLSDTDPSVLYTAGAAISIVSVTFVNTHTSAITVNLYLDSANGGNPRRLIPKDLSLGIGYSLHFDGQRCSVLDASGQILTIPITVSDTVYGAGWNGVTGVAPSKNTVYDQMELRAPKATPTFTGEATIPTIDLTGGQIAFPATAAPSEDPNTMDDYEEGTWTALYSLATPGDSSWTQDKSVGTYTKFGDSVRISFFLRSDAYTNTTGTGSLFITPLPFTVAADYDSPLPVRPINFAADNYPLSALANKDSTIVTLLKRAAVNGAETALDENSCVNGANSNSISGAGIYKI